jgi:RHS repeat-associated protein
LNRLLQVLYPDGTTTSTVYDADGRKLSQTDQATNPTYFGYDGAGRPTSVTNALNKVTQYAYDEAGNRIKKTASATTLYLVSTVNPTGYAQVVEEFTVSGTTNLSKVYTYGLNLISQRVPSSSTNFFGLDGHGSTRFLTDAGANVANVFVYDAFGTLIASNTTAQTAYLYCCEQWDPDLKLNYLRARYLSLGTGRFWTMDTDQGDQQDPLSLHKYLYVSANPVNGIDPSGHDGDLVSLEISTSLSAGLESMYNLGVITTGNALQATILGAQKGYSAQQILYGFYLDTGLGLGFGLAIGKATQFADELIYGGEVAGQAARSACFLAGTPVATESGEKPIEQIAAGDEVWSWNEETGEFQLGKVGSTHVRQVDNEVMVQTADETITATLTHPFRVENKGWVQAGDLQPGDRLISLDGGTETVTETTTTDATALVYNFEVEGTHTYFVGEQPVLVHNACAWATRSASIPDEPGIYVIRAKNGQRYVGQAENLATRLSSSQHKYATLIRDPNSEVFTMSLDVSKVKGSVEDALDAAEDFYIKALGAKNNPLNPSGINGRFQHNPDWMNAYFEKYDFPPMGDPVAH